MAKKISRNTFLMEAPPTIHSFAAVVGKKEGEGPLAHFFDEIENDSYFGQKTWEQAERADFLPTTSTICLRATCSTSA